MSEHTGLNKLDGLGPIYVINMERSKDRKQYIIDHFKKYNIENYTFVDAIDGSNTDLNNLVTNLNLLHLSIGEAATSVSHLKTIEHWLENSDSKYAIIVEDDVSFETSDYWEFSWKDFLKSVDKKYDVLQLAIINNFTINPRLHLREFLDWSAAAYLIKRGYAKRLMDKYKVNGKYTFNINRFKSVAEGVVYGSGQCYSIPLFTYNNDFESNLHQSHINTIHLNSKRQTMEYWQHNSMFKLDLI